MREKFVVLNDSTPITLDFPAREIFVVNPTRGFVYLNPGDGTVPTAQTARIRVPPFSERQIPVNNIPQFGVLVTAPNIVNPATVEFRAERSTAALSGLTFNSPIDDPTLLDTFALSAFATRSVTIARMVGRWLRFHWNITADVSGTGVMRISLSDGSTSYSLRVLPNGALGSVINFSDFSFQTNSPITITLAPENALEQWAGTLHYEFLDRAEASFPLAHKTATRGQFVQFGVTGVGVEATQDLTHGFKAFALGAHVRGNGALCKHFLLKLRDTQNSVSYFELQPNNYGAATTPVHPNEALILPGDVQNFPAGGSAGQTLPVGSVSAFTTGGPQYDFQFSRALDLTVFGGSTLSFTPLDTAVLFANFFIEYSEPF